jgi:hypothetical protein
MPESPYMESPLSSVEVCDESSWNPFDKSFAAVQNSIDSGTVVPSGHSNLGCSNAYQAAYGDSNAQGGSQPFVSLAAINETTSFDDIEDEDEIRRLATYQTSPLSSPTTSYGASQPNWGSKSSRRNSTSSSAVNLRTKISALPTPAPSQSPHLASAQRNPRAPLPGARQVKRPEAHARTTIKSRSSTETV